MTGKTHMVGGLMAGLTWCAVSPPKDIPEASIMLFGSIAGSLLPDIDHPQSKIAKSNILVGTLSRIVSAPEWGHHRRFWHSIWAFIIFGICGFLLTTLFSQGVVFLLSQAGMKATFDVSQYAVLVGMSFLFGSISHGVMDSLTIQGNQWIYPFKLQLRLLPIQTGSPLETVFRIACTVVSAIAIAVLVKAGTFSGIIGDLPYL